MSETEAGLVAEIHSPCGVGDSPLPGVCRYPGHANAAETSERHRRRCRVVRLRPGGHLLFGAQRPDGVGNWLQVGRAAPDLPSAVSKVVGRIWFTSPSTGSRLLVENLSGHNILELRSPRLPRSVTLFPAVSVDPLDPGAELLGTPMVAAQTTSTTLTIANKSTEFVVWIEAPIRPVSAVSSQYTLDPRAPLDDREQAELDDAALRVQLAARENHVLLESYMDREEVQGRLRSSESLQAFLRAKGTDTDDGPESWRAYVEKELRNVAEGRPTHEIHRLILEGLGTPPRRAPKWYTNLVADHLEPDRTVNSTPGGATGGLNDLIPMVKGLWAFRRYQLEEYLNRERGVGIGRDLD